MRNAHLVLSEIHAKLARGSFCSGVGKFLEGVSDMVNDSAYVNPKQERVLVSHIETINKDGDFTRANMAMLATWMNSCK